MTTTTLVRVSLSAGLLLRARQRICRHVEMVSLSTTSAVLPSCMQTQQRLQVLQCVQGRTAPACMGHRAMRVKFSTNASSYPPHHAWLTRQFRSLASARGLADTAATSRSQKGGGGRGQRATVVVAAGAIGMAWLTYEDRRGGLSGGMFEPLTLRFAAVRVCGMHLSCVPCTREACLQGPDCTISPCAACPLQPRGSDRHSSGIRLQMESIGS